LTRWELAWSVLKRCTTASLALLPPPPLEGGSDEELERSDAEAPDDSAVGAVWLAGMASRTWRISARDVVALKGQAPSAKAGHAAMECSESLLFFSIQARISASLA
jgi:hypothetical protein